MEDEDTTPPAALTVDTEATTAKQDDDDHDDEKEDEEAMQRPVKRARTAYFIFADEKRPALQKQVRAINHILMPCLQQRRFLLCLFLVLVVA